MEQHYQNTDTNIVSLVTSIVLGILTSTLLIILVLPAMYGIMEDIGFVKLVDQKDNNKEQTIEAQLA